MADIANHGQPAANAAHIANHGKLPKTAQTQPHPPMQLTLPIMANCPKLPKLSFIRQCSSNIDNQCKLPQPPMQLLLMTSRLALPIIANCPKISQPPMQLTTLPIMPEDQNLAPSWQCCIAAPTTGGIVVRCYHFPSGGEHQGGPKKE